MGTCGVVQLFKGWFHANSCFAALAVIDPRKLTAAIDQLGSLGESGFEPEIDWYRANTLFTELCQSDRDDLVASERQFALCAGTADMLCRG